MDSWFDFINFKFYKVLIRRRLSGILLFAYEIIKNLNV
ncbi:hypothetical protein AC3_A0281 [Clostridium perfringens E str. JGS1987]|uniref:Uncharacterized protein n=1 Tax=Clostridium perfringens E str. JGS1987 TaxID=451755 RepID=B1BVK2_CLOPF|nr:hypothetical protein AC3_A0281 [Clostridium perfringens E str. JGS1987]